MKDLTILRGHGKGGVPEPFQSIVLSRGELWTIVGNTGSGKSRLIKDIEQLSDGDSVTGRHVLLDGAAVPIDCRQRESTRLVAHLGQNMRFVLDTTVEDFLTLHGAALIIFFKVLLLSPIRHYFPDCRAVERTGAWQRPSGI